jgi:GNAT superfamily N-acetyltransferase
VNVAARPATAAEAARIDALATEAIAEQVDGRGGRVWSVREGVRRPSGDDLVAATTDPDQCVLVGTIDDEVVGFATTHVEVLADGAKLGIVTAIYALEGARAVGVGEVMLDDVIAWCGAKGCTGIDAHALPGNRDTKNFFETFGFTARLLVVHRAL